VAEALRGRRRARALLLAEGIKEDDRVRRLAEDAVRRGVPVVRVPRADLDRRTAFANHQGVALEASAYPYVPFDDLIDTSGTILLLDHLQDPQNFGTLLRAAEATGVAGVVLPRERTVDVTPAVVNASAGAVEHLRVARVPNLSRAIEDLKSAGWWAAALDVGDDAADIFHAPIPTPLALVVGAEGEGVGPNVRRHCDLVLAIPMLGRIASLNAATAGSVALFELLRRADHANAPPLPRQGEVAGG
jgi:23S rRNA (guanosine2251-2'-O)-methyltransferase